MPTVGIIAEYNPFHRGHKYQIEQVRRHFGADTAVVAVMSGNFVQRGDCAILSKHRRAELALRGGADLVLELPVTWAVSSAERFARGGVEILAATGLVDTLAFGSETGDAERLAKAADVIDSPGFSDALAPWMKEGLPFAAARQKAVEALLGEPFDLSQPNDLLGVEYLRSLRNTGIAPLAIRRIGAGHHEEGSGDITSATHIRRLMLSGEDAAPYLPSDTLRKGEPLAALTYAERAVLARLRTMTAQDFLRLPDCSEGLENRLAEAAKQGRSLEEVYELAKTKRYAHARIRRLVLWSWLGLTRDDLLPHVPYIRVLGFNGRGQELLHRMKKTAALPVVTKPASVRELGEACRHQFELEARTTDLWQLCRSDLEDSVGGSEWTSNPVILKDEAN